MRLNKNLFKHNSDLKDYDNEDADDVVDEDSVKDYFELPVDETCESSTNSNDKSKSGFISNFINKRKQDSGLYNSDGTLKADVSSVSIGAIRVGKSAVTATIVGTILFASVTLTTMMMINVMSDTGVGEVKVDYGADWEKLSVDFNQVLDTAVSIKPVYYNLTVGYNESCEKGEMGYITYNEELKDDINYGYSYTLSKNDNCWETSAKYLTANGYKEYAKSIQSPYGTYLNIDGLLSIMRYQTSTDVPNKGFFKYVGNTTIVFSNTQSLTESVDSKPQYTNPCTGYSFENLYNSNDGIDKTILFSDYGEITYIESLEVPSCDWNVELITDVSNELPNLHEALIETSREVIKDNFAVNKNETTITMNDVVAENFVDVLESKIGDNFIIEFLSDFTEDSVIRYSIKCNGNIGSSVSHVITYDDKVLTFTASNSNSYIGTNVSTIDAGEYPNRDYWITLRDFVAQSALNQYIKDCLKEDKDKIQDLNLEYNLNIKPKETVVEVSTDIDNNTYNNDNNDAYDNYSYDNCDYYECMVEVEGDDYYE